MRYWGTWEMRPPMRQVSLPSMRKISDRGVHCTEKTWKFFPQPSRGPWRNVSGMLVPVLTTRPPS